MEVESVEHTHQVGHTHVPVAHTQADIELIANAKIDKHTHRRAQIHRRNITMKMNTCKIISD